VELVFEKDAVESVADIAMKKETGARGLRAVLETLMMDLMYEVPSMDNSVEKITITKKMVENIKDPSLTYRQQEKSA
jgi:ATP-dependent Clp protease ATP-binding subunit ClpX